MATIAKAPRKGATHTALSDGDRLAHAKKLSTAARTKANRIAGDKELERSTRARRALRIKADALDEIHRTLTAR